MSIDTFTSLELIEVVELGRSHHPFLAKQLYGRVSFQESEFLTFDETTSNKKIMAVCNPLVAGVVNKAKSYTSKSFSPAYFKSKDSVQYNEIAKRGAGQPFGSTQSYTDKLAMKAIEQDAELLKSQDYIAAQTLKTGAIDITGYDGTTYQLDFGRKAALTKVLTGAAIWSTTTATPIADLEDFLLGLDKPCKSIVFGSVAWSLFKKDPDFKALIDNQVRVLQPSTLAANPLQMPEKQNHIFLGRLVSMGVDLFLYQESVEVNGVLVDLIPATGIYFIPDSYYGMIGYAKLPDPKAPATSRLFMKEWVEEDPPMPYLMSQSANIPFHLNIDATGYMKVA